MATNQATWPHFHYLDGPLLAHASAGMTRAGMKTAVGSIKIYGTPHAVYIRFLYVGDQIKVLPLWSIHGLVQVQVLLSTPSSEVVLGMLQVKI